MELRYFQKGFNYAQDGPGNRLVYHLTGCNMRCPWCANPEGMRTDGASRAEPVLAVAKAVLAARPMFIDGGGLTLTGGEVTVQLPAAALLLRLAREGGVNTCVETNAASDAFPELLKHVDYLIADFKHPDDAAHRRWTGLGNALVKENLRQAARSGRNLLVRVPLIHGVNDDGAALSGFARFFSELAGPNVAAEVLKYHEYGKDKWIKLTGSYAMTDAFVSPGRVSELERAIAAEGIKVMRT